MRIKCKKKKTVSRTIAAAAIGTAMMVSAAPAINNVHAASASDMPIQITKDNTLIKTKYYKDNGLGTAGNFHITGFKEVKTGAHTEGNVLTGDLKYSSNFGTTGGVGEISYAKSIDLPSDGFKSSYNNQDSVMVVGKSVHVESTDNGNAWSLNKKKVDWPNKHNNPNALWQENDTAFADLDAIQNEEESVSTHLAEQKNSDATASLNDQNNETITIDQDAQTAVYNMDQNQNVNFLKIKGFNKDTNQTLVINVDMTGKDSFTIHGAKIVYSDGTEAPIGEVNTWQKGNVVWNFFTKDGDTVEPYRGAVNTTEAVTGHILAPDANVSLQSNINGSVIADTVDVKAESHRSDYTGAKLTSIDTDDSNAGKDTTPVKGEKTLTITQKWDDQDNKAKARPKRFAMRLFKKTSTGDVDTGKVVTLSDTNNWTDKVDVDKYDDNGQEITYVIKPEAKLEGYSTTVESKDGTFVSTSSMTSNTDKDTSADKSKDQGKDTSSTKQEEKTLTITQKWDDQNNKANARPAKVTMRLFKKTSTGDVDTGKVVTLSDTNNWSDKVKVDKYDDSGNEIIYSVKSEDAPKGYTTTSQTIDDNTVFTSLIKTSLSGDTKTDENTSSDAKDSNNNESNNSSKDNTTSENTGSDDKQSDNSSEESNQSDDQNGSNEKAEDAKEATPADKTASSGENNTSIKRDTPQTGVRTNAAAYITAIAAAGVAIVLVVLSRHRKK